MVSAHEPARERSLGAVVIGRNEGERLVRCFESLRAQLPEGRIVYVDSGSSDASVAEARARGIEVVALDLSSPFTAARARNAGFERLLALAPETRWVQFVDGDCELAKHWLAGALSFLEAHESVAIACGRRRERHPEHSLWNRLADIEWDTPVGETTACGGDSLVRVSAFRAVGGFDATLIAGEEPELCLRLRRAGFEIHRLDHEMTLHDAQLSTFSQFWRRAVRAGHAYAEAAALHGRGPERFGVRRVLSAAFWTLGIPLAALAATLAAGPVGLSVLLAYAILVARVARDTRRRGYGPGIAIRYGVACAVAKPAELVGAAQFAWNRLLHGRATPLIEYK